ncbi:MAG TPA: UvrD-helicase domain-containing protein [Clostridia bacterium]|nr:UvrD-helicase domain-containing protein [Clostridia bacterium]
MASSTMPSFVAPDALVRERVLNAAYSFIVQAPAGSGKTELLIQRYLVLLAQVASPESVVAITFTKKAAGEMRARVLKALRDAAANAPTRKEHERATRELAEKVLAQGAELGWGVLENPERLRIVTIDSLCHGLVQRMPWTAKLGALSGITEDARDLYARAAHATVVRLGGTDDVGHAVRDALMHLDNDVRQLELLIANMLKRRDQWMRHMRDFNVDTLREEVEANLSRVICQHLAELQSMIPAEVREDLVSVLRSAARYMHEKKPGHAIAACRTLKTLPGCSADQYEFWLAMANVFVTAGKDFHWREVNASVGLPAKTAEQLLGKQIISVLQAVPGLDEKLYAVRMLPPCKFEDSQWEMLKTIFVLLPEAVQQLRAIFEREQTVDFAEVGQAALGALEQHSPEIALGYTIEHLLVDEFQDTNVTQVKLLEALTRDWPQDGTRTLFLVGDPMQSIYRFRQADVGLFLRAQNAQISTVPLERAQLEANFRSQKGVVEWVNETFSKLLAGAENIEAGAVTYRASHAVLAKGADPAVVVHPFFGKDSGKREAEHVAELVEQSLASTGSGKPGRVAVLVRAREHLRYIVPALQRRGVRFRAVEIDRLSERPTITDLLSLTRALLHLADRVAWLSVLRAPWCGLDLNDLYALCNGQPYATVWQLMQGNCDDVSVSGRDRVARVRAILATALEQRGRMPLRRWVEATWISLGGAMCANETELEDASQYFALLEKLDCGGDVDFGLLASSVRELYAQPDVKSDGSVQLMTIHKAKGLEFDVVILPQLGRGPHKQDTQLLLWEESAGPKGPELFVAPITPKANEKKDRIYEFLQKREAERENNEVRRLLYVAATRARSELHLLGHLPCTASELRTDPDQGPIAGSLLHVLWDAARPAFLAYKEDSQVVATLQAGSEETGGAFRRLADGWSLPTAPAGLDWQQGAEWETATGGEEISYDWVSDRMRHVGTVVHAMLQRIAEDGLEAWTQARLASHNSVLRSALANRGVPAEYLEECVQRAERALANAITDKRGRWILDKHLAAENEFALIGTDGSKVYHLKLDRTFVDEHGVRWIIDYKTGWHDESTRDAFLANERVRYEAQLQQYAVFLKKLDGRAVRVGLYFPLMNAWLDWEPSV